MSFDDLRKIYHFADNSHKDDYWKKMFTNNSAADQEDWHKRSHTAIKNSATFPACDYYLKNNMYYIDIEFPGQNLADVTVYINNHILTIEGKYHTILNDCTYYLKERQNKTFQKLINIPEYILEQQIKKQYKDGLLRITFPAK